MSVAGLAQRRSEDDHALPGALYGVGTIVSVLHVASRRDGTLSVVAKCLKRAAITQWAEGPFLMATIAPIEETCGKDQEAVALSRTVIENLKAKGKFPFRGPLGYDPLWHGPREEPSALADAVAAGLPGTIEQKQEILETANVITRLQRILALIQAGKEAA